MACLQKIAKSYVYECGKASDAFGEITEMIVVNPDDIKSFTSNGTIAVVLQPTKQGYAVQGANGAIVATFATKGGETYPLAYDISIAAQIPQTAIVSTEGGVADMIASNAVIAFKAGQNCYIVGLGAPLSAISVEATSNASPSSLVTWGVDEWQTGTTFYALPKAQYEALKTPAK